MKVSYWANVYADNEWNTPVSPIDDGSYALIRGNEAMTEIVSDSVGSRALWYYKDNDMFMVSTSQRAIVLFLDNFEFNEKVIPWMLSTGTLGPDFSWDKRIRKLKPGTSIILHKEKWELEEKTNEITISENKRSFSEHKKVLLNAIHSTFKNVSFDLSKWILPLSGGHDSRAILYLIKNAVQNPGDIRSITWGLAESIHKEGNDAYVAKKVAETTGIQHKYYHTDISKDSTQDILKRFIENGEGRNRSYFRVCRWFCHLEDLVRRWGRGHYSGGRRLWLGNGGLTLTGKIPFRLRTLYGLFEPYGL